MDYIENPKTKGSGIICGIPQKGVCPVKCPDCFFQSGRSYLEPLDRNLPNMPSPEQAKGRVVRVNDGNDSNHQRKLVIAAAAQYEHAFFNTSMAVNLAGFGRPVVLTVNPKDMTDVRAHLVDPVPANLMFVRFRINSWNVELADQVVKHYTDRKVPVVMTFMAYYAESVPPAHAADYSYRKRTLNSYWVITQEALERIMGRYAGNSLVYACGKNANTFSCARCGNCLREYFATMARLQPLVI